jgi:hypothetical protein
MSRGLCVRKSKRYLQKSDQRRSRDYFERLRRKDDVLTGKITHLRYEFRRVNEQLISQQSDEAILQHPDINDFSSIQLALFTELKHSIALRAQHRMLFSSEHFHRDEAKLYKASLACIVRDGGLSAPSQKRSLLSRSGHGAGKKAGISRSVVF